MSMSTDRKYEACSERSRRRDEGMFGSVGQQDGVLLIEYPWPFGESWAGCDRLPEAFRERILTYRRASRETGVGLRLAVSLLKQQSRLSRNGIAFLIAVPDESDAVLYEFRLNSYDELITFDIPGVVSRAPAYDRHRRGEPLFIACTHGKRDPCCAKYGLRAYRALVDHVGDLAWQATHVGGCRFAGNVVCFPHGIYYGHVEPDEIGTTVQEFRAHRLYLDKYRGRLSLSVEADVAEYFLRLHTGVRELAQFRLLDVQHETAQRWCARFVSCTNGAIHRLHVSQTLAHYADYLSCRTAEQRSPRQYHLVKHEVLAVPVRGASEIDT